MFSMRIIKQHVGTLEKMSYVTERPSNPFLGIAAI